MARNVFRNGASLFRVIENAPLEQLRVFLLQDDENFRPVHQVVESTFAIMSDDETLRRALLDKLNKQPVDQVEPLEVECRRVLALSEGKGPTSLQTIIDRQLDNEACEAFDDQPGDLAKSLWAHVWHRKHFDDAVSFKAIRSWRNADRLFAAFNVDLDGKGNHFSSSEIDADALAKAIGKKLKATRPLSVSLIDLPPVPEYPPSILVIVRFAGRQTSVATHGERGERRLLYYLPQDEAVLIYTPTDERIEVAAPRAAVRNAVAEIFAKETLQHDVSAKPLTAATYDTFRFLNSPDLPLPDDVGFNVISARVVDLELRIEDWKTRLALKTSDRTEMSSLAARYLKPGGVFRRALGVSRVGIVVGYKDKEDETERVLDITLCDGNSCSLNSERDPLIRNFGRKLRKRCPDPTFLLNP